jgi:hypothetical protein
MEDYIKKGDKVNVYWEHINAEFDLEVLHTPQDVGDYWTLKRKDGTIINVVLYSMMEQIKLT